MCENLTVEVAAKYPKATARINDDSSCYFEPGTIGQIISIDFDGFLYFPHDAGVLVAIDAKDCQLELIPLSGIREEDAKHAASIVADSSAPELFDMEVFCEWFEEIMTGNCALTADYVNGNQVKELIDFLRGKGYDCDGLIATGLAIEKPHDDN